jgi:Flp pilus assembly protein TadD
MWRKALPSRSVACIRGLAVLVSLLFSASGCQTTDHDRFNHFNSDGIHRFQQGDYQGARESFEEALKLKPEDPNLVYDIGQCFDRQGDKVQAEKYYRQCLEKVDNHAECRHALAVLLYRSGRQAEAEKMIQDWLLRAPELAGPYAEDGWRLRQEKAYPQARARLQQALHIDPHCVRALVELGILYEQLDLSDRAVVLYERALARNPNQPEIAERLAFLRQHQVGRPRPDEEREVPTLQIPASAQ